jgi:hypothetical protein
LQIEELQQKLHQYTPKELFGTNASTVDGQFWTVEDLMHVAREQYDVEYKSRTSYTNLHLEAPLPELADHFLNKLNSSIFKDTFLERYGYTAICPMFN